MELGFNTNFEIKYFFNDKLTLDILSMIDFFIV